MPADIALWHERALLIFVFKTFQALDTFGLPATSIALAAVAVAVAAAAAVAVTVAAAVAVGPVAMISN